MNITTEELITGASLLLFIVSEVLGHSKCQCNSITEAIINLRHLLRKKEESSDSGTPHDNL